MNEDIKNQIETLIKSKEIFLFMKGTKDQPMCGFSAQVVHLLNKHKVDFDSFNVMNDWDIREGIKEYSQWPTIPQLYIKGEFIGGCDIVKEMHEAGEMQEIIKEKGLKVL